MHQWKLWLGGLVCLALTSAVAPARALMIAPPSLPERVATSRLIVVGKVTGFGPRLIKAELFKGDTRELQIANLQVSESVLGKADKKIEVGFFPPAAAPGGGGRPIRPIRRFPTVQLKQDQEVLLFLTKHPTKDIYLATNYYDVVSKTDNPGFARELDTVKKYAKLLGKPMDGLKSKDADERFLTAAMLIARYRTPPAGGGKFETKEVPAEESKLILTALADADWKKPNPQFFRLNPQGLFYRLGVTAADGWTPPKDFRTFPDEAKKWLKANAGKFRVKQFVAEGKKPEPPSK